MATQIIAAGLAVGLVLALPAPRPVTPQRGVHEIPPGSAEEEVIAHLAIAEQETAGLVGTRPTDEPVVPEVRAGEQRKNCTGPR